MYDRAYVSYMYIYIDTFDLNKHKLLNIDILLKSTQKCYTVNGKLQTFIPFRQFRFLFQYYYEIICI